MNGPFDRKRAPPAHSPGVPAPAPGRPQVTSSVSRSEEDEARSSSKHRAALEALFAPKPAAPPAEPPAPERPSKKMVVAPAAREEPGGAAREKRLAKLLAAEGRAAVTQAAEAFAGAGFLFPEEQEVMLQLLEHADDDRVKGALTSLGRLLDMEAPQRRTVLEARLRRLEDAEDPEVCSLASALRRRLLGRGGR